jgi:hypothetical protein
MKTSTFIAGITTLFLATGTAHAAYEIDSNDVRYGCDFQIKIIKNNIGEDVLHVLIECNNREEFHEDWGIYHPRGGPHDHDHRCLLDEVERIDRFGYIIHTTCKYAKIKRPMVIQLTDNNTILITNPENY